MKPAKIECQLVLQHTNFIMQNHRVHQTSLMPGATFLDIVFRILAAQGMDCERAELRNIMFPEAIATYPGHDRRIVVSLDPGQDGAWQVRGKSQWADVFDDVWKENFRAELHFVNPPTDPQIDVAALKKQAIRLRDNEEVYRIARSEQIVHGPAMKCFGKMYQGRDYLLAELALDENSRTSDVEFYIHPAKLDSSTLLAYAFTEFDPGQPFIPVFIGSFRAPRPAHGACYVYISEPEVLAPSGDVIYNSYYLCNDAGEVLAYFGKLACKCIRHAGLIQRLVADALPKPEADFATALVAVSLASSTVTEAVRAPTATLDSTRAVAPNAMSARQGDALAIIMDILETMVADALGVKRAAVDAQAGFYQLGLESVMMLQMAEALEKVVGVALYPTLLFEFSNISSLAQYLAAQFGAQILANADASTLANAQSSSSAMAAVEPAASGLLSFVLDLIAKRLNLSPQQIAQGSGFYALGLESVDMLQMSEQLEQFVGKTLYPTLLFEFSDIASLVAHLEQQYGPFAPLAGRAATSTPTAASVFDSSVVATTATLAQQPAPAAGMGLSALGNGQQTSTQASDNTRHETAQLQAYQRVWQTCAALPPVQQLPSLAVLGAAPDLLDEFRLMYATQISDLIEVTHNASLRSSGQRELQADLAQGEGLQAVARHLAHSKTPARHVVWVVSPSQSAEQVLMGVTALLQALVGAQINPRVALVVQGEGAAEDARFYALAAMARTVALEMPGLWCRAVALLDGDAAHRIVRELLDEQRECAVKLAGCTRQLLRFSRLPASVASGSTWRKGGKYLIAGGAGGIGWQLAQYLARQHGASVMLLGRSPQNSSIAARLATWHASGEDIHYLQADVTDAAEVQAAVAATRERFGAIHGVIHAAGVVRDALFFRKQSSDMLAVLGPKLIGARNLDQCTAKDDLDCFILFSSVSASIANIGQSDYAFANAWLEAFAAERQARSERPGKTLAIGWPYWEQGGMNVHDKVVVQGIKSHGLYPMPTAVGLAALDALLASNVPAVTVSYAVAERFERVLAMQEAAKLPVAGLPSSERAVAIIGLAGRYPDAENMDQFWHNLANGHDSVRDVPLERWDHAAIFDARRGVAGKTYGAKGGFIDRVSGFDAPFFGISRKEAELMDPQERLFLMTCWHTLEDAGYAASDVADTRTGVFAGVMWNHYQQVRSSHDSALPTALHASVANRVSFCLNLHGPSLTLDTMCSSSLSALHLAAESVRRGECDLALAGGVNLALHPNKYLQLAENHFLSDDGLCRSFGKGGTGYVPGEGVGAVLLKPLDQALADGDHVYAVLRASSMNHSGKTSGYTVPSPVAQSSLLRATWQRAALNPKQLGYIEAHGTGTTLGDPIEVDGIRLALEDAGVARQAIAIGSVKSNIGHLESAAGIAGVSKVLLQMQHKQLAPSLHTAELNPHIDFSRAPVRVQRELGAWPANRDGSARVAGVSAFGAGGSNVHVLLEEYPAPDPLHDWHESQLFVLSAKDAKALHAYAQRFVAWLDQRSEDEIDHGGLQRATLIERIAGLLGVAQQEVDCQTSFGDMGLDVVGLSQVFGDAMPQQGIALDSCIDDCVADSVHDQANLALPSLCDLAYTMQTGRMAMPERLAIVVSGKAQLRATLQAFIDDQARPPHAFWGKPAAVISRPASSSELLFQQGEWRLLASLWQAGADVPWRQCYQASRVPARRVSLPLYPFAQESYWLGGYKASLAHAGTGPLVDIATVRASASASVPAVSSEPMSASAQASASVPRPASASAPDQSDLLVLVQVFVEGCLCKVLYLGEGELDAKQSFNDLGLSSTGALELIEDINQHFGLTLEVVVIYDHPCLEDLTRHICTCTALDVTMQSALLQAKPASVAGNSTGSSQPTNTGIAPTDIRSLATTSPTLATSATLSAGASNAPSVVEQASEPVSTNSPRGAIAVIGMSGRFPDAPDLDAFWHNLQRGHCSARQVDDARWDSANYYDADGRAPGKTNARTAALLDQVDRFDAGVFNISPLAAQLMDPQQRIFLEQAWAALEDAGYGGSNVEKTHCGVYVGCAVGDYIEWIEAAGQENTGEAFLGVVPSILAARISYRLNLSGPALAVDTACSSSLVAIHLACESIRSGECDMALAGGVALMLTPQLQVRSGKMGILSVNGRCAPFDVNANGTVMGEGVGVLVLKDLARAKADGDTIHGVIYASGMNSDGKTNGITAPSADAQEQLVRQVLRQARLQPSDLGYVEAHGTGTYLGDPIEVNALKRVFGPLDGRGKHCGLGSVKSNIGHTTLAAGVASVIKLLLGLRAGQLPPSLNFTELNPKIDLQDSPLFVQTGLSDWQAGPDGRRLAGVSSFGFSGTNCHLVLGDAPIQGGHHLPGSDPAHVIGNLRRSLAPMPQPFLLSGRDSAALVRRLADVRAYLARHTLDHAAMADMAYTLATGRTHFGWRLGLVATTQDQLLAQVDQAVATLSAKAERAPRSSYSGRQFAAWFDTWRSACTSGDADGALAAVQALAQAYHEGAEVDWALWPLLGQRRISLPTYPFARDRHWLDRSAGAQQALTPVSSVEQAAHSQTFEAAIAAPMVAGASKNINQFSESIPMLSGLPTVAALDSGSQVFICTLAASSWLVAEHVVNGRPVLPGVVSLEMAVASALRASGQATGPVKLGRVRWLRPVLGMADSQLVLRLSQKDGKTVFTLEQYEAGQINPGNIAGDAAAVCVTGQILRADPAPVPEVLDLANIAANCPRHLSHEAIYQAFADSGIAYGSQFRVLQSIELADDQALGTILLDAAAKNSSPYQIHPGMMDGAFQTIAALQAPGAESPVVPFALDTLECLQPVRTARSFSLVQRLGANRYSVQVLDAEGQVCIRCTGFSLRATQDVLDGLSYVPVWRAADPLLSPLAGSAATPVPSQVAGQAVGYAGANSQRRVLILHAAPASDLALALRETHRNDLVAVSPLASLPAPDAVYDVLYFLAGPAPAQPAENDQTMITAFHLFKALIGGAQRRAPLNLKLVVHGVMDTGAGGALGAGGVTGATLATSLGQASESVQAYGAGILGMARALGSEYPRFAVDCIDVGASLPSTGPALAALAGQIAVERSNHGLVALRGNQRLQRVFEKSRLARPNGQSALVSTGHYLVIGGAGGLGFEVSCYLAQKVGARLLWVGRRAPDAAMQQKQVRIASLGGKAMYVVADLCDEAAMRAAIAQAEQQFGRLRGALHIGGVFRDMSLASMDLAAFEAVLAPKVKGVAVLERVLAGKALDFVMLFSTAASFVESAGQANYAAASTFEDAYALAWRSRVRYPLCVVNWGYFGSAGAVSDPANKKRMAAIGLGSLEIAEACEAMERVLVQNQAQTLVIRAQAKRLTEWFGIAQRAAPESGNRSINNGSIGDSSIDKSIGNGVIQASASSAQVDPAILHARDGYQRLELLSQALLAEALAKAGWMPVVGASVEQAELAKRAGVLPEFARLFAAMLDMAARSASWRLVGNTVQGVTLPAAAAQVRSALLQAHPDMQPHVTLLENCVNCIVEVIAGRKNPMEILFPKGSVALVQGIYKGQVIANFYNALLAQEVVAKACDVVARFGRPARILEIGAGTGGTTSGLLPALAGVNVDYCYTDVSSAFLHHGKQNYSPSYPFMRFALLDIGKAPASQGFVAGDYDIILATMVLHVVPNIVEGMRNVAWLLAQDGTVFINEVTKRFDFLTLTFGMLSGWWAYQDDASRLEHAPMLSPAQWRATLAQAGFAEARTVGVADIAPDALDQALITGVVRSSLQAGAGGSVAAPRAATSASVPATTSVAASAALHASVATTSVALPRVSSKSRALAYLKQVFAETLKFDPNALDELATFESFGVDSLLGQNITGRLEDDLGDLPATLLFEYMTLDALADYMVQEHAARVQALTGGFAGDPSVTLPLVPVANAVLASAPVMMAGNSFTAQAIVPSQGVALAQTANWLKQVFAEILKFDSPNLDSEATFESFGVDSLNGQNIIARMEQDVGDLPATLLFEHLTIAQLAQFMLDNHQGALQSLLGVGATMPASAAAPAVPPAPMYERAAVYAPAVASVGAASPALAQASATPGYPSAMAPATPSTYAPAVAPVQSVNASPAGIDAVSPAPVTSASDIAVIGVSGRYPQSPTLEQFWQNLAAGKDMVGPVPESRGDWQAYLQQGFSAGPAGYLDQVDLFDPLLFGILPRDAVNMDPQERLFLETCWHLLESSGYLGEQTRQTQTGVFVGSMYGEYGQLAATRWNGGTLSGGHSSHWSLANRVSYCFDFQGPSFAVDSACSSSLTAVHLACESLLRGDCKMAIAGGVNVILHPAHFASLDALNMLSSHGRSMVFDERADGFAPGEGVGAVLLRPLADALASGDRILAVIKGSMLNAGGKTGGYTVPNPNAQAALIGQVMQRAGIDARTVSYVETHGTGTALGDPIEVASLARAYHGAASTGGTRCALGAVKSNVGHLEGAAGIVGLTKVLLQFQHQQLAPCVHLQNINPKIDFSTSPFYPQRQLQAWEQPVLSLDGQLKAWPRRAGVSSFGAGGANAHLILEEYKAPLAPVLPVHERELFLLSARTPAQLQEWAGLIGAHLESDAGRAVNLAQLTYTSQIGRKEMAERLAVVAQDTAHLAQLLQRFAKGETDALMFVGNGNGKDQGIRAMLADDDGGTFINLLLQSRNAKKLGQAWVQGVRIDWQNLWLAGKPQRVELPGYPFERKRYWMEFAGVAAQPAPDVLFKPVANSAASSASSVAAAPAATVMTQEIDQMAFYSQDHVIRGQRWIPGVMYLEWARKAAGLAAGVQCEQVRWLAPLNLDQHKGVVQVALQASSHASGEGWQFAVSSQSGHVRFAEGRISQVKQAGLAVPAPLDLAAINARCPSKLEAAALYAPLQAAGLQHGPAFQVVRQVALGQGEALAWLAIDQETLEAGRDMVLHPSLLDGALQTLAVLDQGQGSYVPVGFERLRQFAALPDAVWVWAREVTVNNPMGHRQFDLVLADQNGATLLEIGGLSIAQMLLPARRQASVSDATASVPPKVVAQVGALLAQDVSRVNAMGSDGDMVSVGLVSATVELQVEQHLQRMAASFLMIDDVEVDLSAQLLESGFDSISLVELLTEVNRHFKLDLAPQVLFDCPTLHDFACFIAAALPATPPTPPRGGLPAQAPDSSAPALAVPVLTAQDGAMQHLNAKLDSMVATSVAALAFAPVAARAEPAASAHHQQTGPSLASVNQAMQSMAARFLMVAEEEVDLQAEFLESGFDSVSLTELLTEVNQRFGLDLAPQVLFDCPTLASFAQYLLPHLPATSAAVNPVVAVQAAPVLGPVVQAASPFEPVVTLPAAAHRVPATLGDAPTLESVTTAHRTPVARSEALAGALGMTSLGEVSAPALSVAPFSSIAPSTSTALENDAIAIIGVAGLMPQSDGVEAFWQHLIAGDDMIRAVPEGRPGLAGRAEIRAGFLDQPDAFDARFFKIAPREATAMDPQQRLFLEVAWRAIEDAGLRHSRLAGSLTGVFVGVGTTDYNDLMTHDGIAMEGHTATGIAHSILANRVSYVLDLQGPSEVVDTACSSALVAIHRAVTALRMGECSKAIAGGVNLTLAAGLFDAFNQSGMLSQDAKCKTFDDSADGYVRGEGAGAVVLMPLTQALAEGAPVYAVIRGSAVNHGGRTNSLTAPSAKAQARVIVQAYRNARIDPASVSYIEAHGTGTRLGDPIEVEGLKMAFAELAQETGHAAPKQSIAIGSVKTNIGHLEAAAGIAGVLKVVMAMKHGQLPANLHFREVNPYLRLDNTPFYVVARQQPWPATVPTQRGMARRAAVSSFGFGGTNAHVILESFPVAAGQQSISTALPFILSAPSQAQLLAYAQRLDQYMVQDCDLNALAITLLHGRDAFAHRLAFVASSRNQLREQLQALLGENAHQGWIGKAGAEVAGPLAQAGVAALARDWVGGLDVQWAQEPSVATVLPVHGQRLANVPGFPFMRESYWFAKAAKVEVAAAVAKPVESAVAHATVPVAAKTDAKALRLRSEMTPSAVPVVDGKVCLALINKKADLPQANPAQLQLPKAEQAVHAIETVVASAASAAQAHAFTGGDVADFLRTTLAELLDLSASSIGEDEPFADFGLDSIFGIQLIRRLNQRFGLDVRTAQVYESQTITLMVAHCLSLGATLPSVAAVQAAHATTSAEVDVPLVVPAAIQSVATQAVADLGAPVVLAAKPESVIPATAENLPVAVASAATPPDDNLPARLCHIISDALQRPFGQLEHFPDAMASFDMLRVISKLEGTFGPLKKSLLFDYVNVESLATFLQGQGVAAANSTDDQAMDSLQGFSVSLHDMINTTLGQTMPLDAQFADVMSSFDMLRVISDLEAQFGPLKKSLLFDVATLPELAVHLLPLAGVAGLRQGAGQSADKASVSAGGKVRPVPETAVNSDTSLFIKKVSLPRHPELEVEVAALHLQFGKEGGLPGRDIAPYVFIGKRRGGYFNCSQSGDALFSFSYVGTAEYLPDLAHEYVEFGRQHGMKANFLSLVRLEDAMGIPMSATPFGVLQRLEKLREFTLDGGKMRKLRYLVNKFAARGHCRTDEYQVGSNPAVDQEIVGVIDKWAATKKMVNPYVVTVRAEIARGVLAKRHRMFLTYVDQMLTNAIIVTHIPSENGYLLDLEFYCADAPLGGLEYAIAKIFAILIDEGDTFFSFGGTFGVKVCDSENTDPVAEQTLAELRELGLVNNDGNVQFKNKFGSTNLPVYLCRAAEADSTPVFDILLMIASPEPASEEPGVAGAALGLAAPRADALADTTASALYGVSARADAMTSAGGRASTGAAAMLADADATPREQQLQAVGYNPVRLAARDVEFDLLTDSWAELEAVYITRRMAELRSKLLAGEVAYRLETQTLLPFDCVRAAASGRNAEAVLCRALPKRGSRVLSNALFPSWAFNLMDHGMVELEVDAQADPVFGGNMDLADLEAKLLSYQDGCAFVAVELSNNARGGQPVSVANLRAVRELTHARGLLLVIDATRVLENAAMVVKHEAGFAEHALFDVATLLLGMGDAVTMGMSKDFGCSYGGLVATSDSRIASHIDERIALRGNELNLENRSLLARALADRDKVTKLVRGRMQGVQELWGQLRQAGVPVVGEQAGTHCVLIDCARLPQFAGQAHAVESVMAWIYRETGVRAARHLASRQNRALQSCIRLAVPVGLDFKLMTQLCGRLVSLFQSEAPVLHLALQDDKAARSEAVFYPVAVATAALGRTDVVPSLTVDAGVDQPDAARPDRKMLERATNAARRLPEENFKVVQEIFPTIERKLLQIDGVTVEVMSAGQGPLVLLMHPFNIGAGLFAYQFRDLSRRHQVVSIHHPGVGATGAVGRMALDGVAELFVRVLEQLGIKQTMHIAGASAGGLQAQAFVHRFPELCASMTLIGSSFKVGNRNGKVSPLAEVIAEDMDLIEAHVGDADLAALRRNMAATILRCESMDPKIGLKYLDEFANLPDLRSMLGDIRIPTQVLQGRYDSVIAPETTHILHQEIPGATLEWIETAGHFPTMTDAAECNARLLAFFDAHPISKEIAPELAEGV